jgi:hypothetical protein
LVWFVAYLSVVELWRKISIENRTSAIRVKNLQMARRPLTTVTYEYWYCYCRPCTTVPGTGTTTDATSFDEDI